MDPAGTRREKEALARMLEGVNRRKLTLPSGPFRRPVRFYVSPE